MSEPVVRVSGVTLKYGNFTALDIPQLDIPAGCSVAMIGPDGVGKSSLLSLISGTREIQKGKIMLFGGDLSDKRYRSKICPKIAYMPQGLGKNLYPTLSVFENVDFFGGLFGLDRAERKTRIDELLIATELSAFAGRPAGKLSGGMKQKLGLCCALIHDPDILILDEPTTGVDPLSRRLFWDLIHHIQMGHSGMSVLVATAYMEEATRFDKLIAMNEGRVLYTGTVSDFLTKTNSDNLEKAFIAILPEAKRQEHKPVVLTPRKKEEVSEIAIEATNLTMRFGDFTAVDHVSFKISRGEIFGFLGSNGCGKTTTMKMLTGLLVPSEGESKLFGQSFDPKDIEIRKRVGYMSQSFSLYTELTVKQNLNLHAHLFNIPEDKIAETVDKIVHRFGLGEELDLLPDSLPLGVRQRLSLAVALIHGPDMLILDEPTSGVDPIARDAFWQILIDLSRNEKVTIFISTHFMNEAERCDRISFMHAGRVLACGPPRELVEQCKAQSLEEAFIKYLEDAGAGSKKSKAEQTSFAAPSTPPAKQNEHITFFSVRRMMSYLKRESLELVRDPIRLSLSIIGSIILMLAFAYGITIDVENLSFAVLDRDETFMSRDYAHNIAGSRYFIKRPPIVDYEDLNHRLRNGDISLGIEIPPGFARDVRHGRPVSIGAWIDGAMPRRAEIIQGYVLGMHLHWLENSANKWLEIHTPKAPLTIQTRFLFNQDVKSLPAMVPAVISVLLMMIPAILSTLSVVREKELGSIVNFYATPVSRFEFLLGKQLPYVLMAMINFVLMLGLAVLYFDVPIKGSLVTLAAGSLLYVIISTSIGLLFSTFTNSQIAAIFGVTVVTMLPTTEFSGMLDPVSSLEGLAGFIGSVFPTTFYLTIARGTFSKGLGFEELDVWFIPLLVTIPILVGLTALLLKKQER